MNRRTSSNFDLLVDGASVKSGNSRRKAPSEDTIKVICRFRPLRKNPKKDGEGVDSFRLHTETGSVEHTPDGFDGKMYNFDQVFGSDSKQSDIFSVVSGVLDSVMSGFNGTIMAYGQTSAGKSWTMDGPSIWEDESQGIIPRCVDSLFDAISQADASIQFQVSISYFEVYCEKIRDLLNPQQCNLKTRQVHKRFVVKDLTEVYGTDKDSVLRVIEMGKTNRASAPTLMNAESSRSHSIVSILVTQKDKSSGRNRKGSLYLVDLAGSEKVGKTGATGVRFKEAKNINGSLTTLGMVINALCEGQNHIPYRDSKLTLILMDALGGNSKTTLIICCNPELSHTQETLSTLRYIS